MTYSVEWDLIKPCYTNTNAESVYIHK